MEAGRILRHLVTTRHAARRAFPAASLERIEAAVRDGERTHDGEVRFAVESALELPSLLADQTPRERALEVFSLLRVWDTERNNGLLIYLLYADRDVEIVADRGFNGRVEPAQWEVLCARMREYFARGEFEAGVLAGVAEASAMVARHFPLRGRRSADELPDQPVVL
ncbi:MAG: hypothetical protein AMJ58_06525 [Gammaproteobacteria bacterium SG8_30]|jgi:uncharacterized membrane protein|nr:MAG: hypothetical protein AMJ58_06525 [Gammaproteobacteria bacterium SG8_30]